MQPEGGDPHGLLATLPLRHSLPLRSAMATVGAHANASAESHELQRMEPPYTNYTAHFVGTLDYMFYTYDRLSVGGQPRSREIARDTPRDMPRDTPRDMPLPLGPRAQSCTHAAHRPSIHCILCIYLFILSRRRLARDGRRQAGAGEHSAAERAVLVRPRAAAVRVPLQEMSVR